MQKDSSMRIQKHIAVFLHLMFLTLAVFGISMMYLNLHYGKGVSIIHETKYEDSDEFAVQLQQDIDTVFQYVAYRDVFEYNGYLDMSQPFVTVRSSTTNSDIIYTIDELVRHARTQGYYLDENYNIVQDALSYVPMQETEYYVVKREYGHNQQYTEPGDAFSTITDLSLETLECLSGYYRSYQRFFEQPTNLYFQIYYEDTTGDRKLFSNAPDESINGMKEMGRYCFLTGDSIVLESNLTESPKNIAAYMEIYNPYDSNAYYLLISVDTSYQEADVYAEAASTYEQLRVHYLEGLLYLTLGILGLLATLYYLILVSGYRTAQRTNPYVHGFDMVTTESCIVLTAIAILFALFLSEKIGFRILHLIVGLDSWPFAERMVNAVVIYLCCLVSGFSLLRRYKTRQLWTNSTLYKSLQKLHHYATYQGSKKLLTLFYFGFILFHLIVFAGIFALTHYREYTLAKIAIAALFLLILVFDIRCFSILFKKAVQQDRIMEALDNIAGGDTAYLVNADEFTDKEQLVAKRINSIGVGLESALREKVKSERLKADLITNVSHDIKTPLTSIINYVDLIKREHLEDPKIQGYLEVLEQKSQRLKTLTEDLVEASKASSGNLKLDISEIDLVQLVHQTNGEFEEKFSSRNLILVAGLPSEPLIIAADGRQLWRVLENLYNNAYKYAMEHSRVYVDVTKEQEQVCLAIKNISQYPLNIRGEELTERFVRGDVSRSTEGSGLGLSIAQSLVTLQKGRFQILIDGDLFKVLVNFPLVKTDG